MTFSPRPAGRSDNADWIRALQRTAAVTPASKRTLAKIVAEMAARHPDRAALISETTRFDYATLAARADLYSRWAMREGLHAGDTVALMMANAPDYAAIWIGLSRVGVVTALLNTQLVGDGLAHCIALAAPRRVIVDADRLAQVAGLEAGISIWIHGPDVVGYQNLDRTLAELTHDAGELPEAPTLAHPALLIYTSGTTGLPKAAHVSHYRIMMWSEWFAGIMDARADDRLYDCLPMYHSIGGVVAIGAMLVSGGAVILRDGFSASRFWGDIVSSGATIFQYIGELCRYLVNAPDDTAARGHRLRLCCGNGLRAGVWEAFERRFEIPRIIEFYAATEGSFSLFNLEGRPGSIGRIPRFMAHRSPVAIVRFDLATQEPLRGPDGFCIRCGTNEAGEAIGFIAASAENLATRFEGYTNPSDSSAKMLRDVFAKGDTWFRTGDLMRADAQGFFIFVDRIGDTFRWKGENVATSEVADALCACAGVLEASVYGVELPNTDGRAGMAALVVASDFEIEALGQHVAMRLPKYARPIFLRLRDSLDTTGTFKVRKGDLVRDGFSPDHVGDRLYFLHDGRFQSLDHALYTRIMTGDIRV